MEGNKFVDSLNLHQKLVDEIVQNSDETGVCHLTVTQLAANIGRSESWVYSAIKQLNVEDDCIIRADGGFKACYRDISKQGVFHEILLLIFACNFDPSIYMMKESELAQSRGIKLKTVQMFKGFYEPVNL